MLFKPKCLSCSLSKKSHDLIFCFVFLCVPSGTTARISSGVALSSTYQTLLSQNGLKNILNYSFNNYFRFLQAWNLVKFQKKSNLSDIWNVLIISQSLEGLFLPGLPPALPTYQTPLSHNGLKNILNYSFNSYFRFL